LCVAEHRTIAARERQAAAEDREEAARDRQAARADRQALARKVAIAETDPLTGARTRLAGLAELDREINRCRRNDGRMVVCYVNVVGLKAVNDTAGHDAGDEPQAGRVGRPGSPASLRPDRAGRRRRVPLRDVRHLARRGAAAFGAISTLLRAAGAGAIRTGFAALTSDERAGDLISRADQDLLDSRTQHARRM